MKNWLHNCMPKVAKIALGPFRDSSIKSLNYKNLCIIW
jgi:hypothetical protein